MSLDVYLSYEKCEHCGSRGFTVYDSNITHNLTRMAHEAILYAAVWRSEEAGIERAHDLIEPLRDGIKRMKQNPEKFRQFSASNGWGTYEQFVTWLEEYLRACEENPKAFISTSR